MTKASSSKTISYQSTDDIGRPDERGISIDFITLPFVEKPYDQLRVLFHITSDEGDGHALQEVVGQNGDIYLSDGLENRETSHELFCKDRKELVYDRHYATDKGIVILSLKFSKESEGRYLTLHQKFPHKPEVVRHFGCL